MSDTKTIASVCDDWQGGDVTSAVVADAADGHYEIVRVSQYSKNSLTSTMSNVYPPLEAGCVYHIYNRGIDGCSIFHHEKQYYHFLKLYAQHCNCVVDTYAYCLLGNHFHLLVRVKNKLPIYADLYPEIQPEQQTTKAFKTVDPSRQFAHLFNAYAQHFNKTRTPKRTGGLFEEPFRRKIVEHESYLSNLIHYIHFNPQKHGLINDFKDYPYSSYHSHLLKSKTHLAKEEVLDWFGNKKAYVDFHDSLVDEKLIQSLIIEVD